jgi:hypothetical protein
VNKDINVGIKVAQEVECRHMSKINLKQNKRIRKKSPSKKATWPIRSGVGALFFTIFVA